MNLARWLLLGCACLALVIGGGLWWTYHQATQLPDWYTEQSPSLPPVTVETPFEAVPEAPALPDDALQLPPNPPSGPPDSVKVPSKPGNSRPKARPTPTRQEERNFHRKTLLGHSSWSSAILGSRYVVEGDRLEVAVIIAPNRLDRSRLKPRELASLDRALALIPGQGDRPVALTLLDRPRQNSQGELELSPQAQIRLGDLNFSLDNFAQKLGGDPQSTRRTIGREMQRLLTPISDDEH